MSPTSSQQTPPTNEEIAFCAYLLWEKEGRPHGRDHVHWLQAEEQLLADFAEEAGMLDADVTAHLDLQRLKSKGRRKSKKAVVS
jgi:hypothetical protein